MNELAAAERRALRARAHALNPTVMIGESGLSPAVLAEIERNLHRHELIKVRVLGVGRNQRKALLFAICAHAGAQPVQHIGRMLVLYRQNPEPPSKKEVPKAQAVRQLGRAGDRRAKAHKSAPHVTPPRRPRLERATRRKPRPR